MRLGGRRAGSSTQFVSASGDEVLLEIAVDDAGKPVVAFHLYDSDGNLVKESKELKSFPRGLCVQSKSEELLLLLPGDPTGNVEYCLYDHAGQLLTCSDGRRTQIFSGLRVQGSGPKPTRSVSAAAR